MKWMNHESDPNDPRLDKLSISRKCFFCCRVPVLGLSRKNRTIRGRTTFLLKANPAQSWSSFPLRLPLHTWASQGLLELGNIPIGRCLTAILHVSISDPFEDWTHMWLFSFFLLRTCETSVVSVWLKICEYKAGYIYIYLGIGELLWSVLCISSNCFEVFCAFHRKVNWAAPL